MGYDLYTKSRRTLMKLKLILLSLVLALTGCATLDTEKRAINGQLADLGSTGIALTVPGIVESNPLGILVVPVKYAAFKYAETLPIPQQIIWHRKLSAFGWGAAVNNLCTVGVALSGGASAIPCLFLGLGSGMYDYQKTKPKNDKEEFDRFCVYGKKKDPNLVCIWTDPTQ